ncbi:MAG: protein translocase subunit SecD [Candidatus Glassbacteria bacterium]
MDRKIKIRLAIIIITIVVAVWYLWPSVQMFSMTPDERENLKENDPIEFTGLMEKSLKLGLDLQGGMHLVLELDTKGMEFTSEEAKDAIKRALEIIRNRVDQFGVSEPLIQLVGDERIIVELPGIKDEERAKSLVKSTAFLEFKIVESGPRLGQFIARIDSSITALEKGEAVEEPVLEDTLAGRDIFAPAKEEFETDERPFSSLLRSLGSDIIVLKEDIPLIEKYLNEKEVKEAIPKTYRFQWGDAVTVPDGREYRELFLLRDKAEMTGEVIADARATIGGGYDPNIANQPIVQLEMTRSGARLFEKVTGAHIEERLAIVLDGIVKTAPVIRSKISGGSAVIEGIPTIEEARDIAIVLRAGALPAPLEIIEERTVGPSLGHDSIEKGKKAGLIGLIAVMVFMLVYYKFAGILATLALILNIVFVLAALAGFRATLTLPGIAGLILTIGMAVDANVLIYERIREELETGKTVRASIDAGYDRAFKTILDANITTIITAIVLLQFGTGPVKGFAVTLTIGIIASMFTAIYVTRTIFHIYTGGRRLVRLSI